MTPEDAKNIIEVTTDMHLGAEKVERYVGNPHVEGDNLAEHTSRMARMAVYIMPFILEEFKNHSEIGTLAQDIYATIITHDDDEVAQGYDIITVTKNHNSRNQEEIDFVKEKIKNLPPQSFELEMRLFSDFRKKDTLASRITKALDNITGNQLVYEQKMELVSPDGAKFLIWYAENVRGISRTTDMLVDSQIQRTLAYRNFAKNSDSEIDLLTEIALQQEGCNIGRSEMKDLVKRLLAVDLDSYELDKNRVLKKIWEFK
jgi:5'-deoxynucleotidase YfbR-like HD superfamily hydrolase